MLNIMKELIAILEPFDTGSLSSSSAELTYTDLNLIVTDADNGRSVCRAMISIDAIGMTAICSNSGNVRMRDILPGFYLLDIIAPGYIARSMGIIIQANYLQELHVKMVSNC